MFLTGELVPIACTVAQETMLQITRPKRLASKLSMATSETKLRRSSGKALNRAGFAGG
jgi:hypothetical protein